MQKLHPLPSTDKDTELLQRMPCLRSPLWKGWSQNQTKVPSFVLASAELLVLLKLQYCGGAQRPLDFVGIGGFSEMARETPVKDRLCRSGVRSSLTTGTTGNSR